MREVLAFEYIVSEIAGFYIGNQAAFAMRRLRQMADGRPDWLGNMA
jgi:hypothetical protein